MKKKRILLVLLLLLLSQFGTFADTSLLRRSLLACNYEELVQMSLSYGLDSSLEESALRQNLLAYFDLDPLDLSTETQTIEHPTTEATPTDSATSEIPTAEAPDLETPKPQSESIETVSSESEAISQEANQEDLLSESTIPVISIGIENASRMDVFDDLIIVSGDVVLNFTSESTGQRTLTADRVVIDTKTKLLQAIGDVVLSEVDGDQMTFTGQAITLDWGNLNIVVFDGVSSTTRSNSTGKGVLFFLRGDQVSYSGDSSGVFFQDGTISTAENDPYWSISAQKLSLAQNDMFVDRAVLKLGRVPVFYFPLFFYPGTRLSFNPAIGMSSTKGAFLSTTFQVYGEYPKLGISGTSSDAESTDISSSFTSLLESEDTNVETIRDGIYYRPLEENEELPRIEQWARGSGSYLALFADIYQNLGLSVGFDTKNTFFDKKLNIEAIGLMAYKPTMANTNRLKYSLDFKFDYSGSGLDLKLRLPVLSDPNVRSDFLNRNTDFNVFSIFGGTQYFPNTYSSQSAYTWSADASYSKTFGNYTFSINSLKADVDFRLNYNSGIYKSTVEEASLPYINLSSSGTFFDISGQSKQNTRYLDYTNELARQFAAEQATLSTDSNTSYISDASDTSDTNITSNSELPNLDINRPGYYVGPNIDLQTTTVSESASIKMGYTYNQVLDNIYERNMQHDYFNNKINGTLYLDVASPGRWFTIRETIKPQLNFTFEDISKDTPTKVNEFYLNSELKASSPKLGITYNLTQRVYSHYDKSTTTANTIDRWGKWDSDDISVHNITFSKDWKAFTIGLFFQIQPLTEEIRPSLSFSKAGFTIYGDFSVQRKTEVEKFEKGKINLNLSYTNSLLSLSVANNYDFTKIEDSYWQGYTLVQKASIKPLSGLAFTENATFENQFKPKALDIGGSYSIDTSIVSLKTSATLAFKAQAKQNLSADSLNVSLKLTQDKVRFWKNRIVLESAVDFAFNYDFENPFKTYLTAGFSLAFSIAEFLDLGITVTSANKSFSRYYQEDGHKFSFKSMIEDLLRSFDFLGDGRNNTGFNLSGFKLSMVHYMRDWNLYVDANASLVSKGKPYEWVPSVTVYVKWNAIPELKAQGNWNAENKEWY